jgi:hypothetical protein
VKHIGAHCFLLYLCWGKWPSEAFTTSGRAVVFGSRAASAKRGKLCNGDLTETLMLLKIMWVLCAGTAQPNSVGLRCRKLRRRRYGGTRSATGAPRLGNGGGLGELSRKARRVQGEVMGCFGAEGAGRRDTWLLQTCKGDTVRGRDKGRRV